MKFPTFSAGYQRPESHGWTFKLEPTISSDCSVVLFFPQVGDSVLNKFTFKCYGKCTDCVGKKFLVVTISHY